MKKETSDFEWWAIVCVLTVTLLFVMFEGCSIRIEISQKPAHTQEK